MKSLYETFKCRACGDENETQNHVLNCKILLEMNKDSEKQQYEKLFSNNLNDQIKICKQFRENMKIMEEMKTWKNLMKIGKGRKWKEMILNIPKGTKWPD